MKVAVGLRGDSQGGKEDMEEVKEDMGWEEKMAVDPLGDSQGVKEDRGQGVKMVGLHGDSQGVKEDVG